MSTTAESTPAIPAIPTNSAAPALGKRDLEERVVGGPNCHQRWYAVRNDINGPLFGPVIIVFNYLVVYAAKHWPSLTFKRWVFNTILGMKLGKGSTIASGATLDYFFPELIEIGENTIIGMDAMILTHEFLHDRWRKGPVRIGANVLVGAQSLILAGVTIGAGAKISAKSLVHKSVPDGAFVGGVPINIL